jgi:hypothetical protein
LLLGLFASSLSVAQGGAPSQVQWKPAASIHDSTQRVSPFNVVDSDDDAQPGPYAKYLIHTGVNKADAIRAARSVDQDRQGAKPVHATANSVSYEPQGWHAAGAARVHN